MSETQQQHVCLTADEIFSAKDLDHREWVPLPEWGTVDVPDPAGGPGATKKVAKGVYVRTMSMTDRGKVRKAATVTVPDKRSQTGIREVVDAEALECGLTAECAVDADGRRLFKATDVEALHSKRSGAIAKVAKVAMKMAGLDPTGDPVDIPS